MVKSIVSSIIVLIILIVMGIYEMNFVSRQFKEFDQVIYVIYEKVENHTATENDIYSMQQNWLDKKKYLHIFIPHTEIKEMDLWISESIKLVKAQKWDDALSKIEVLKELSEQIPKNFLISIENIL